MVISRAKATSRKKALYRSLSFYLYLLPTFALLGVFSYYPPLSALYHAFFDWSGAGKGTFVGLANFHQMLQDEILIGSARNLAILVILQTIISVTVPLLVAELIFGLRSQAAKYWYRLLLVLPMVVPWMVNLLLWQFLYDPDTGLLNAILRGLGLPEQAWLNDPHIALYCLVLMGFPWVSGTSVLIYLAGLNNISSDILDACRLDGAHGWKRFLHVDVPLVMGQIKLMVILSIIGGLQGFGAPLILTAGGPGYATMVPGLHLYYSAFQFERMGYACAIGLVMFIVLLGATYLNMRYIRSSIEYETR